ncbi:type II toxin-antitoxin system VapC family toxin [Leptolyngbya sp. AN03gr2]|uniref:type II toxin-antitoxin system VapC family toxin n=1 Tax=unclassified Leptolyngbya TaxID=2650499 RepID=UPI003D323800
MSNHVLVDTNILVDVIRGFEPTIEQLATIEINANLCISSMTQMELIVGCRDKAGLKTVESFLTTFEVVSLSELVAQQALELLRNYNLSHGLLIPDALIAATALVIDAPLLSRNQRDFRFIGNLNLLPFPA